MCYCMLLLHEAAQHFTRLPLCTNALNTVTTACIPAVVVICVALSGCADQLSSRAEQQDVNT
jgi:hypothetical protein